MVRESAEISWPGWLKADQQQSVVYSQQKEGKGVNTAALMLLLPRCPSFCSHMVVELGESSGKGLGIPGSCPQVTHSLDGETDMSLRE